MSRVELKEELLEAVSGGSISYDPYTAKSISGRIGLNGNYTHVYDNEEEMLAFYGAHYKDKAWTSVAERDNYIFNLMIENDIIHLPE